MSKDFPTDNASTSKVSPTDAALDKTMEILESLVIDWESKQPFEGVSRDIKNPNDRDGTAKVMEYRQVTWRRRNKWTPYSVPRRDIPVACSVQAARPPTPDGEVDELSEYFAHFVRVDLKMSSLAESMYV
ncbi:hypothetical protein GCK32_005005 [Trichostrongylus colubriformis]|uniref:Uncharacterized protein n=1 Tax=Trichostrongylus colubriformis TaxID=6319 RepID=A0AAN8IJW3_TRICO